MSSVPRPIFQPEHLWTVPALKQAKIMRKLNMSLRAENKALKKEVSSLKKKLGKLAH
jgi:hypothetical protein